MIQHKKYYFCKTLFNKKNFKDKLKYKIFILFNKKSFSKKDFRVNFVNIYDNANSNSILNNLQLSLELTLSPNVIVLNFNEQIADIYIIIKSFIYIEIENYNKTAFDFEIFNWNVIYHF